MNDINSIQFRIFTADKYKFEIPIYDKSLYFFDPMAAHKVCWFFETQLHHIKGKKFSGKKFILEQWQINFLAQLYGMKRVIDGLRQYQEAFLAVPRKNGKSTLSAGIALYGLYGDDEKGAEVYSAAGDKPQAAIIFEIAKAMVDKNPKLLIKSDPQKDIIKIRTPPGSKEMDTSFYKVVSSEAYSKHGLNPSTIVFDEFHTQPNRDLYEVYTTATGSRDQPIIVFITTAGDDEYGICKEKWDEAEKINRGNEARIRGEEFDPLTMIVDDTILVCIYAASANADWHDPEVWKKANPCLGTSIRMDWFLKQYAKAKRSPAEAKSFKQLNLNMWVKSYSSWIDYDIWLGNKEVFTEDDLREFEFVGGADFSSVKDITALGLLFRKGNNFYWLPYFFMPLATIERRSKEDKVPYDEWVQKGYIYPMDGNAIDQKLLLQRFLEILKKFKGNDVVVDSWGAEFIMQELSNAGYTVNKFGQTLHNYTAPTKFTEACILNGRLKHNNNPVMNWMVGNVRVFQDGNGNIKPMKPKGQVGGYTQRVDGMIALILAMSKFIAAVEEKKKSVYQQEGRLSRVNGW